MSRIANQVLRSFALVVTDRRWAAPLSAMALGFGLFVGVAIGPSAAGSLAGTAQIVEVPSSREEQPAPEVEAGRASGALGASLGASGDSGGGLELEPAPEPVAAAPAAPPTPEEPSPEPAPPAPEAPAQEGEETELKGVVVHANPMAGSYALVIKGGELVPIHARKLPRPGAKLSVVAERLANGTFAEAEPPRRSGKTAQASFRGTVTFADPDPADPAYTVSGRGASLLVHVEPDPSGAVPELPALGAYVSVTAAIEKPAVSAEPAPTAILSQRKVEVEAGEPATYLDLAGVLTAVMPETSQISLSADGGREGGEEIALTVPADIDTAKLRVGDSYLATATIEEGGSLTLAGLVSDEHRKGADDASTAQGDLARQP